MQVTREVAEIINSVVVLAKNRHYELVTPELVLYVICGNKIFAEAFEDCGGNISELSQQLEGYFNEYMVSVSSGGTYLKSPIKIRSFLQGWEPCCLLHGSRRRAAGKTSSG